MEELEKRIIRVEETQKTISFNLEDIKMVLKEIATSLSTLAVLEEKHKHTTDTLDRIFSKIDTNSKKIELLEKEIPHLKLASTWVFTAMIGLLGSVGTLIVGFILWKLTQ